MVKFVSVVITMEIMLSKDSKMSVIKDKEEE